jgi:anti-sigma B factor antagonist
MYPRVVPERSTQNSRPLLLSIDLRTGRVTVAGELDRAVAHRLGDALAALAQTDHRTWTVDAAAVTFCDAEGLRALAAGAAMAESRGCTLRLVDVAPFTARLLRLVGMEALLDSPARRSPLGAA